MIQCLVSPIKKCEFHLKSHGKPLRGFKQTDDRIRVFKCHSDCSVETG